jgi:hypothetical protein
MPKLQGATQGQKPPLASKTRVGMVEHVALFVWIVRNESRKVRSRMEAYSGSASRNENENENENVRRYALAVLAAIIALLLR